MSFKFSIRRDYVLKGAEVAKGGYYDVYRNGQVTACYKISSNGAIEIEAFPEGHSERGYAERMVANEGPKRVQVSPGLSGITELHENRSWLFLDSGLPLHKMLQFLSKSSRAAGWLRNDASAHTLCLANKENELKDGGTLLFVEAKELSDVSVKITFRSLSVNIVESNEPIPESVLYVTHTDGWRSCSLELSDEEAMSVVSHLRPEVTFLEELSFVMDFSEGKGHYFLQNEFGELEEQPYSKVLPLIRMCPYLSDYESGFLKFMYGFSGRKKLSTIVTKFRKYPMLLNVYKTYGEDSKAFLRKMGIHFDNIPGSFEERTSMKKVFGVSNALLKKINQCSISGDTLFWLLSLSEDVLNPQVKESIIMEFLNTWEYLENTNHTRALQFADTGHFISGIMVDYGGRGGKDYDFRRLLHYITDDVYVGQGITNPRDAINLLSDYYHCLTNMGVKIKDWFPKSLKLAHDIAVMNREASIDEENKRKFNNAVSDEAYQNLTYKDENWVVLAPKAANDLILEGRKQSHCVGSYVDYVANKQKFILFMRRTDDPDTPVITLDVKCDEMILTQYRGFGNRAPTDEEMEFIRKWAKKKKLKIV